MDRKLGGLILLLAALPAAGQEIPDGARLVTGNVYGCTDGKVRYYTNSRLPGMECRRIQYQFLETQPPAPARAPARPAASGGFYGYRCTRDCSGHLSGFQWAQQRGVYSHSQCSGNSQSFVEGCWAWVDQQGQ